MSDWVCFPCPKDKFGRASNFHDRETCRKCGKPRHNRASPTPAAPAPNERKQITFKPGDWLCIRCNDHQFRDNKFCRKCNASKPANGDNNISGSECVVCFEREKNTGFLHGNEVHPNLVWANLI